MDLAELVQLHISGAEDLGGRAVAKFLRIRKDRRELFALPEDAEKGSRFLVRALDQSKFGEDDGPADNGKKELNDQDNLNHRA